MIQDAAISPDGKRVAILGGPADDRRVSIATIDQTAMPTLKLGALETIALTWAGDQYVIARIAYWDNATSKAAYRIERNLAITTEARAINRLLDGAPGLSMMTAQPIIGISATPAPKALVLGDGELWYADVATGKGTVLEKGNDRTFDWAVDSKGEARVRVDADYNNLWVMARMPGAGSWKALWTGPQRDLPPVYYGYSEPDQAVYLFQSDNRKDGDGEGHLIRRKLDGTDLGPFGPTFKAGTVNTVWDENRHLIVGFESEDERPAFNWLDDELGATHRSLAKLFPGKDVVLHNWSADRQRFVVRVSAAADPAVWYLFDKARKELSPLGEEYPELKGVKLGETRWFRYKARDGLEMPAYLTMPPAGTLPAGTKPPLVVMPHGGPGTRDDFDFDFITQFLASRGYAVLRPQFRGSSGFGRAFEKAGEGEWGGKMQTDLLDGMAAVAGEVDTSRACIVGSSFGGYAALAAATLHPEAYRCAASFAGISDLGVLIDQEMRAYGVESGPAESLRKLLGKAPRGLLESTSPARLASKAGIPVLLIHGNKDTVVRIDQSALMLRAMQNAGKPVEMVTLADENHYLTHSTTRTQMLEAIEAFLAKNLPVSPPAVKAD